MAGTHAIELVAEWLWSDVRESDLRALDERSTAAAQQLVASAGSVCRLGFLRTGENEGVEQVCELGVPHGSRTPESSTRRARHGLRSREADRSGLSAAHDQ